MNSEKNFIGAITHNYLKSGLDSQLFCNSPSRTVDSLNLKNHCLIKTVDREFLTGSEDWFYDESRGTYYYNQYNKLVVKNNSAQMMCNYFIFSESDHPRWGQFCNGENQEIHFNFDNGDKGINGFKSWLKEKYESSSPVVVYYVMEYPKIISRRCYYNSNPRFKGVHSLIETKNGGLTPSIVYKKSLNYEKDNIYKKNFE